MADVSVKGLKKAFGSRVILDGVDLAVASGNLIAILGPSGSGKTTLLRLLCGFERADAGTIRIGGELVSGPQAHVAPERRHIGYVAQEGALFPHLSVADNVAFGLPLAERRAHRRVGELLELVGLPGSYAARPPQELSGGEQQRVALARALAPAPRLVLLDEPFSSLDAALRADTRRAVAAALFAVGATALLVTHDQSEALSMGHEVAVLWNGRIAQIAKPEILYRHPATPELASFVGEAVLLRGFAEKGRVLCSLGRLPTAEVTPEGPVEVVVRPEQIRLLSGGDDNGEHGAGVKAQVGDVNFYGHDASISLRLLGGPTGEELTARGPGHRAPATGEVVFLVVEGRVATFKAAESLSPVA